MKLWLVVYVGQSIYQVFGPLPMTYEQCEKKAASYQTLVQKYDNDSRTAQLVLKCEFHLERPNMNTQL
jgi:hypothetical protein